MSADRPAGGGPAGPGTVLNEPPRTVPPAAVDPGAAPTTAGTSSGGDEDARAAAGGLWALSPRLRWTGELSLRAAGALLDLALVAGVTAVVLLVASRVGDLSGGPKGSDAWGHYAQATLLLKDFPHILWNDAWYAGIPNYPGTYAPLYMVGVALVHQLSGIGVGHAMFVMTGAIYALCVASLYGFVRVVGRSRMAAAAAALLLVVTPALWQQSLVMGVYPRMTAMALGDLATFFAAAYARRPNRWLAAAVVLGLAGSLDAHPIVGVFMTAQAVVVLVTFAPWPVEVRLRRAGAVLSWVFVLVAWFYVPYFLKPHAYYLQPPIAALQHTPSPPVGALFGHDSEATYGALPAVLLPAALAASVGAWLLIRRPRGARGLPAPAVAGQDWYRRRRSIRPVLGVMGGLALLVAGFLAYVFAGDIPNAKLSVYGVAPLDLLVYTAWPLAAVAGIVVGRALGFLPALSQRAVYGAAVTALAALLVVDTAPAHAHPLPNGPDLAHQAVVQGIPATGGTRLYRVAGTVDEVTAGFNGFSVTPQVRGYLSQSILSQDDQTRLEVALKQSGFPAGARRALVDWYGVRWMYAGPGPALVDIFRSDPTDFQPLQQVLGGEFATFTVRDPQPVLEATAAPAVLVIGPQEDYQLVTQDLQLAGLGSRQLIPVEGTDTIDDYSPAELDRFSAVVLYGAQANDPVAAAHLLAGYVQRGGGLLYDVAGTTSLADAMAQAESSLFPVRGWRATEPDGNWGLTADDPSFLAGIDLHQFSPPLYGSQPWLTEVAAGGSPSTQAILSTGSGVAIEAQRTGRGTVVESGLNLPYHITSFTNVDEAAFLGRLVAATVHGGQPPPSGAAAGGSGVVGGVAGDLPPATGVPWLPVAPATATGATIVNSDAVTQVVAPGSTGVLFKENDYPDWHATLDGRPVTIVPAGPGMMYVPLPAGATGTVRLSYRLSTVEVGATGLTVLGAVGFLLWLVLPRSLAWAVWRRAARSRPGRSVRERLRRRDLVV